MTVANLLVVAVAAVAVVAAIVVVVVAVVDVALAFAFLSLTSSFLSFASFLSFDVVDVLVDDADGLTWKVRVAVCEEVVDHLTYLRPSMMWSVEDVVVSVL